MFRLMVLLTTLGVSLLLVVSPTQAEEEAGELGWLYVTSHLDAASPEPGTQFSWVFVYDETGMKIPGGGRDGGWETGRKIPLGPGTYWVGVSTRESKNTLQRFEVVHAKSTVIETGWIAVSTIAQAQQPQSGCAPWSALLLAYVELDGERDLVASNASARPDDRGAIQLLPGTYSVHFNNFTTEVVVEPRQVYELPLGRIAADENMEEVVLVDETSASTAGGLRVCLDGAMDVLPGIYSKRMKEFTRDRSQVSVLTRPITIEPRKEGRFGHKKLKRERPTGTKRELSPEEGRRATAEDLAKLTSWGEKHNEFADLEMFADPM